MRFMSATRALAWIMLFAVSNACTQYKPQGALTSVSKNGVGLVPTACMGRNEVFTIIDGSSVSWDLETINKDGSGAQIGSKHRAFGFLNTTQGKLSNSEGIVTLNLQDLGTGDVARDRILRDLLFTKEGKETFRVVLDKISTSETGVGAGNSKKLTMVAKVEVGGQVAPLIFPAEVSEKDGVYHAIGDVEITTRNSTPAFNAISMKDRIEKLASALKIEFSNTMNLKMDLLLKKDCR